LGRQEEVGSVEGLYELLKREGVTVVTLPPSVLAVLKEEGLEELEVVIAAGEACSEELVKKWGEGRRFFNAYGPTEATVCAAAYECGVGEKGAPPIGKPILNTKLYIVDGKMEPVPVGVRGELCIGGVGLARGYLKREEMTREKFVQTKWGRVYRSGDVGRWRKDGNVEYVGRQDGQVKLRGYRIELGEVEEALRGCEGVRDAAVTVKGERLVGYVVGQAEGWREQLRRRLPEYMVPGVVVELEELPVLPNGKVDRKGLPDPEGLWEERGRRYVEPGTETERKLAEICGGLLKVERVGAEDSFFEMGGHSLLATQFLSRVREAFGVELPLRAVFEAPTVAGLAQKIDQAKAAGERAAAPAITAVSRDARRRKRSELGGTP
jgi:acyl carrier protein